MNTDKKRYGKEFYQWKTMFPDTIEVKILGYRILLNHRINLLYIDGCVEIDSVPIFKYLANEGFITPEIDIDEL
jgi:hypothetical protein